MKSAFKALGLALLCFFLCPGIDAQNPSRTDAPYIVPQTIFVGDSGRLVIPLGRIFSRPAFILENPELLSPAPDLLIKRIELERRGESARLLIDFVPYAPGTLSFPDLSFLFAGASPENKTGVPAENLPAGSVSAENPPPSPAAAPAEIPPVTPSAAPKLSGLEVHVASILTPSQMTLSEPASPLAVPGTSFLIYGTVVLVLLALSAGIGGSIWGRRHFAEFWERFRRRRLLRGMMRFLKRMRQECGTERVEPPARYLTLLSGKFRGFLSLFTGFNCRSLTAGEFLELPLTHAVLTPAGLCRMFRNWDTLRFSGRTMDAPDLLRELDEAEKLVAMLDRAERDAVPRKPPQGAGQSMAHAAGETR